MTNICINKVPIMLHKQVRERKVNSVQRHPRRLKNHGEENKKKTRKTH